MLMRFRVCLVVGGVLLRAAAADAACFGSSQELTYPGPPPCDTLQGCIDAEPCNGGVVDVATSQQISDAISFQKGLTLRAAPGYKPVLLAPLTAATPADTSKAGFYIRIEGLTFELNGSIRVAQNSSSGADVEVVNNTVGNGGPQASYRGIELAGGSGSGAVGFVVSGNKVTIEGETSEVGIRITDLPNGSYGSIANNLLDMEHNGDGGAIYVLEDALGPVNVDMVANRISGLNYGFGIVVAALENPGGLTTRLLDNAIAGQTGAQSNEGAIVLWPLGGTIAATVVNNTVTDDLAGIEAISSGGTVSGLVANNVVSGNSGVGLSIGDFSATLANRNNLVFGNGSNHFTPGPGTLVRDPLFAGNGDYHLRGGSPAIDAADDSAVPGDLTTDLDGRPRKLGAHTDLGAYEAEVVSWPGQAPCNTTLQACIDAVLAGDEVQIAKNGSVSESISFAKSLALRPASGFAPVLTGFMQATPMDENDLGYRIRIEGLTFQGDGGIEVDQASPSPLAIAVARNTLETPGDAVSILSYPAATGSVTFDVSDNAFTMSSSDSNGGVGVDMRANNATGRIANNSFSLDGNVGGIFVEGRGSSLTDVIGNDISGTAYGAGISVEVNDDGYFLGARILDNLVTGATSESGTGVLLFRFAGGLFATVVNNTIADNSVGFDALGQIHGLLANNIVSGNTALGLYIDPDTVASFANENNLVFGNGMDTYTPGSGTLDVDPLFFGTGNYRLRASSPAIDAGNDGDVPVDLLVDLDGNPRIHGSHVDIGAFEVPEPESPALAVAVLLALGLGRRRRRAS